MSPLSFVLIAALVAAIGYLFSYYLKSRSGRVREAVVRCEAGHLFTAAWPAVGRQSAARSLLCPVGDHVSLCRTVDRTKLSSAELRRAQSRRGGPPPNA